MKTIIWKSLAMAAAVMAGVAGAPDDADATSKPKPQGGTVTQKVGPINNGNTFKGGNPTATSGATANQKQETNIGGDRYKDNSTFLYMNSERAALPSGSGDCQGPEAGQGGGSIGVGIPDVLTVGVSGDYGETRPGFNRECADWKSGEAQKDREHVSRENEQERALQQDLARRAIAAEVYIRTGDHALAVGEQLREALTEPASGMAFAASACAADQHRAAFGGYNDLASGRNGVRSRISDANAHMVLNGQIPCGQVNASVREYFGGIAAQFGQPTADTAADALTPAVAAPAPGQP